eukprot:CAMPEP_0181310158 /NCGR_PEP_ID=MMETSP1101-20121128/12433_1 /TAXON_ID=46948 /ORGANISM="Rhodomonas abbreviata, Strain Caron Lab Isolate" /LENGTH=215 /DNA_ID=CAMNT_0023416761 /DNA_START=48 /DNA_END=691 /DNA_ORIENTATION=-
MGDVRPMVFGFGLMTLLYCHPEFIKDAKEATWATLSDTKSYSILLFVIAAYNLGTKLLRYYKSEKTAGGVGMKLKEMKGLGWVVVGLADTGAGAKAGMRVNDVILEVNGVPVPELKAMWVIRGPVDTTVKIKYARGVKEAEERVKEELQKEREEEERKKAGQEGPSVVEAPPRIEEVFGEELLEGAEIVEVVITRKRAPKAALDPTVLNRAIGSG